MNNRTWSWVRLICYCFQTSKSYIIDEFSPLFFRISSPASPYGVNVTLPVLPKWRRRWKFWSDSIKKIFSQDVWPILKNWTMNTINNDKFDRFWCVYSMLIQQRSNVQLNFFKNSLPPPPPCLYTFSFSLFHFSINYRIELLLVSIR